MSKPTPGPWEVREGFSTTIVPANGGTGVQPIATVSRLIPEYGGREASEANARIMAAGPEMLAALKDLAALFEKMAALHPSRDLREVLPDPAGLAVRTRLVIAKSEGR